MTAGRRSKTVAFIAILALTTFGALATASAQQQIFPTAPRPVITSRGPVPLAALPPTAWADERTVRSVSSLGFASADVDPALRAARIYSGIDPRSDWRSPRWCSTHG